MDPNAGEPKPPFERIRDRRRKRNIEICSYLGKGTFTEVYRGKNHRNGQLVAVKVPASGKEQECRGRIERECDALARIGHPNIEHVNESNFKNSWGRFVSAKVAIVDPAQSYAVDFRRFYPEHPETRFVHKLGVWERTSAKLRFARPARVERLNLSALTLDC